jgi:hypothetical protein
MMVTASEINAAAGNANPGNADSVGRNVGYARHRVATGGGQGVTSNG